MAKKIKLPNYDQLIGKCKDDDTKSRLKATTDEAIAKDVSDC